jgi:hypothetical protein
VAQALAAHAEEGDARQLELDMSREERDELTSLLCLVNRLDARMEPVRSSPAFVESLGEELVREAERRALKREKRHRIAVISAAVAGAIVSIASLVGGVVVLVKWLRTRAEARQASTA